VTVWGSSSLHVECALEELRDDIQQIVSSETAAVALTTSGLVYRFSLSSGSPVSLCHSP